MKFTFLLQELFFRMNISRYIVCLAGSFLIYVSSFGQKDSSRSLPKKNSIYIEAFGQGLLNSFSYDRLFRTDKKIKTSVTAGVTIMPSIGISDFYTGAQISGSFLYTMKNHHIEAGLGLNFLMDEVKEGVDYLGSEGVIRNYYLYFTPKLGYRFQRPQGGIFFRLTFTPLFAFFNRVGAISVENELVVYPRTEIFSNVVSFGNRVFPWGGVSIGYTF